MTDHATDDDGSDEGRRIRAGRVSHEIGEAERPSEAVVRAVASVTDTPVLDLDPLYRTVDPAHLDGMFDAIDGPAAGSTVEFDYAGCRVAVTADSVHVRERDDG